MTKQNQKAQKNRVVKVTGWKCVTGSAPLTWIFFLFCIGGNCLLSICSVYSIYLSFLTDRHSTLCLVRVIHPPPKKKKKNTRSGAGNAAYTPCFCSQASKLLPDQTYQLFWGVEENIKLFFPQLSLCPSRFLISKLATKAHHCWKHPRALNTDVSKLRSPCWHVCLGS